MLVFIDSFRGEAPRITPRALPDNAAQTAINASLLTGDMWAWSQFVFTKELENPGTVLTIYLLAGLYWLSFEAEVEIARGIIPGDTTHRTYITGLDLPRWTNVDMATGGPEPWPFDTRPIGVPNPDAVPLLEVGLDPTPTTFSIDVLDQGDSLASDWTVSPFRLGSTFSRITQTATEGNPAPSYQVDWDEIRNIGEQPYAYRNFGIQDAQVIHASCDVSFRNDTSIKNAWFFVAANLDGAGVLVGIQQGVLFICDSSTWSQFNAATLATEAVPGLVGTVWYTIDVVIVANADGTATVTASLFLGSGELASFTATGSFDKGGYCGIMAGYPEDSGSVYTTLFDNIHVQASGSTGFVPENVATSYVFTFVNDVGEESGPSPPSSTVLRPDGVSVTITTPTSIPTGVSSDYGITTKRIYRSVTSNTGTIFAFVAEIPLSQADYTDVLTDAQLGEALESEGWEPPPDDLRNIIALPNGIMAGSSKNRLCLSARNRPHAWPIAYRLTTETDIVGLGAIDTTVVLGTKSFPYIAAGNDPAAFSMNKIEIRQACVSRRSFASVSEIGVIFASPDGLISVAGTGLLRILTVDIFTREQWQLLRPETITALSHDDTYWFFFEGDPGSGFSSGDASRAGYALDMSPTGFGLVKLGFHAEAIYADPETDNFYLALDSDTEPTNVLLPVPPSTPVDLTGNIIYQFDADPGSKMVALWRSKLFMLPRPGCLQYVQIRAVTYANMVARFFKIVDGVDVMFYERVVVSEEPFVIPTNDLYSRFFVEVLTTDRIQTIQCAERVEEFR